MLTKKRKSKEQRRMDAAIQAAFDRHGNCIQFNVMDLPKLWREVETAFAAGGDIDEAMKAAIAKYRQN